ncbi:MAG: hypothetical protein HY652_07995 [Acidobacteria bacterium]|nr:hypothetical protein [Acidobacteriota bacterium]
MSEKSGVIYCDQCGAEMINQQCRLICKNCGYFYSCSDFVYSAEPGPQEDD